MSMKKYPWDNYPETDWSKSWSEIAEQYQAKYFKAYEDLIDCYFISKLWKAGCITGWIIAGIFAYCLFEVSP